MTRGLRTLASALALAAIHVPAAPLAAQTPPPPIVLEVDVDVVSVTAVVHDSAGRFVGGLGPKDVELS